MNIAIIFGASGGMGEELSRLVSFEPVDEIWLVARRREALERVVSKCEKNTRIIEADLLKKEDLHKIKALLADESPNIKWLINCAGIGYYGNFCEISEEKSVSTVELNCASLVTTTYMALPYMENSSHLLFLSSASAFLPQPKFAVYSASKAFVLSFGRALRRELKRDGISVSVACPGPVDTEFLKLAYKNDFPKKKKPFVAHCDKVCKTVFKKAKKGRAVILPTFSMKLLRIVSKILPHSLILRFAK
jgi:short-subunit dehydrogenase